MLIRALSWVAPLLAALALSSVTAQTAPAVEEGQNPHAADARGDYAYQLFVPRGYLASGEERWPLMIFLHGSGERGDDLAKVKVHGPPQIVANHPGFPFVVLSPQLPADQDWDTATLERMLARVQATLRIDPSRLYLTGLSRGGHATWRWAKERPELFAAVAPVAGRGVVEGACRLAGVPLWAFHGDRDDVVEPSGSFAMVDAIRQCDGATPRPRLTIYSDLGHNSWDPAYDDPALYLWLLEHRRPAAE